MTPRRALPHLGCVAAAGLLGIAAAFLGEFAAMLLGLASLVTGPNPVYDALVTKDGAGRAGLLLGLAVFAVALGAAYALFGLKRLLGRR